MWGCCTREITATRRGVLHLKVQLRRLPSAVGLLHSVPEGGSGFSSIANYGPCQKQRPCACVIDSAERLGKRLVGDCEACRSHRR